MAWTAASLRSGIATVAFAAVFTSASARAQVAAPAIEESRPIVLLRPFALVDQPESIYPDPEPPKPNTGVNEGGVHISLNVSYLTDYVYRGIDRSEIGAIDPSETGDVTEDAPNLQFNGKLTFDLGRAPHPFVGLFANVYNDDPVSRFQEVRPYFGLDWTIRPLRLTAGWQTYIYPERDDFNTSEIFGSIEIDDSVFFRTDRPIFAPYIYAAYDHDLYDGLYLEAGLKHDFVIEGTGVTLTLTGNVGFVAGHGYFTAQNGEDTGFQHYEVGLIGAYSLNTLANISKRYGDWKLRGYLFYTDGLNNDLRADTQIWGGVGIGFDY
ncbi:hypothetical protein [Humisphaera borealis]|uniref:Transporter n=1 Tax=Humisphaera borealis TaxID=2807512 RepID=A0A7M2WY19_9BACT|nr:hypothetical protein [Humisphaera borealis]QOV90375.1 hypothetical protein IPV69_03120 [Humisphaera borealis]